MNNEFTQESIDNLSIDKKKEILIESAEMFYSGKKPKLTDEQYDKLETQIISADPSFNVKNQVKSLYDSADIMHSCHFQAVLFKYKGEIDAHQLLKYGTYLTPKYDGCSIVAYYRNGAPYKIVSRGNDYIGKNQTKKLWNKVIKSVDPEITEVFYEAVTKQREKSNGLINSKYKQDEVDKLITLIPWGCYSENSEVRSKFMDHYVRLLNNESDEFIKNALSTGMVDGNPIDGLVCHNTTHHTVAIGKIYFTEKKVSKVVDIEKNFSWTTGLISGVVHIDPVYIDGALIRKVKVGTIDTMMNLGTGIGAEVEVIRSGRVIPHITKVIKPSNDFSPLDKCVCGGDLIRVNGSFMCTNDNCSVYENWILVRIMNVLFGFEYTKTLIKDQILHLNDVKDFIKNNKNLMKELTIDGLLLLIHVPGFSLHKFYKDEWTKSNSNLSMIDKIKSIGKYLRTYAQINYYNNMSPKFINIIDKLEVK